MTETVVINTNTLDNRRPEKQPTALQTARAKKIKTFLKASVENSGT